MMGGRRLIVSLHDCHPGSLSAVREQVRVLSALGVDRFSLLVVPRFHHGVSTFDDAETMRFLDAREHAGDDLALHGFYHQHRGQDAGHWFWNRVYTAGEAECHGLDDRAFAELLDRGRSLWQRAGWGCNGFIAPAWLLAPELDPILARAGFLYTTRLRQIVLLQQNATLASQALCFSTRARWRAVVSRGWNRWLYRRLAQTPLMRLSLHPGDLHTPAVWRLVLRLVERALRSGFRPSSYAQLAAD